MKTIWKFEIDPIKKILEIPKDAKILSTQVQNDNLVLWALVDPENTVEKKEILIFETGHYIDESLNIKFIDTFQVYDGQLVFHVFERLT